MAIVVDGETRDSRTDHPLADADDDDQRPGSLVSHREVALVSAVIPTTWIFTSLFLNIEGILRCSPPRNELDGS